MNPVLVEVTRGALVESVHRGAIAVVMADGSVRAALGDITSPIYPRSALKPVQALPLVETGAADAFGLGPEEIALACASHSSEPMHVERVEAWLQRIRCSESDLACGPHELRNPAARAALKARGVRPGRVHNNCSGKHTGFLTVARHVGAPTTGYERIDHPVQQRVADTIRRNGDLRGELPWGIDGCAVPNFAVPLAALARMMAQLADPSRLPTAQRRAAERIRGSMQAHPELVAGTGRVCTRLMLQQPGEVVVKTGAEGVFAGALPRLGLGLALKIDDGAGRGSECAIAAALIALGALGDEGAAHEIARAPVPNTRGDIVGERRPAAELMGLRA